MNGPYHRVQEKRPIWLRRTTAQGTRIESHKLARLRGPFLPMAVIGIAMISLAAVWMGSIRIAAMLSIGAGITLLAVTAVYAWRRSERFGAADLPVLFIVGFGLYAALLPIEWGIEGIIVSRPTMVYPDSFSLGTVALAGWLSVLAALSFMATTRLLGAPPQPLEPAPGWMQLAGLSAMTVGGLLALVEFARTGGIRAAIALTRGARNDTLSEASGAVPYTAFLFAGLALLWVHHAGHRTRRSRWVAWGGLIAAIGFHLPLGSRRMILYALLIVVTATLTYRPRSIRQLRSWVALALVGYLLFAVFGHTRYVIPHLVAGTLTVDESTELVSRNLDFPDVMLPSRNEFAGPQYSLLARITEPPELDMGWTYVHAFVGVLPGSMYPGEKPLTPSHQFADDIYRRHPLGMGRATGWGYSPVAESIDNFGWVGPLLVFAVLGAVLVRLSSARFYSPLAAVLVALVAPQMINLQRTSFNIQEALFYVVAALLMSGPFRLARPIRRGTRSEAPVPSAL